jgi:hypothetical protein
MQHTFIFKLGNIRIHTMDELLLLSNCEGEIVCQTLFHCRISQDAKLKIRLIG